MSIKLFLALIAGSFCISAFADDINSADLADQYYYDGEVLMVAYQTQSPSSGLDNKIVHILTNIAGHHGGTDPIRLGGSPGARYAVFTARDGLRCTANADSSMLSVDCSNFSPRMKFQKMIPLR